MKKSDKERIAEAAKTGFNTLYESKPTEIGYMESIKLLEGMKKEANKSPEQLAALDKGIKALTAMFTSNA